MNELDKLKQEAEKALKATNALKTEHGITWYKAYCQAVEDVRELVFEIMREEQPCYASELARTLTGEGVEG